MSSEAIANPLAKHFRQAEVHFKLPSKGKYWPEGSLDMPVTGELPVYPMTSKDEIILKTPDALMNGSSVATVIQSCCPNIKDPWMTPAVDVDALLIAIRIASYGNEMEITCTCPACNDVSDYEINLPAILDTIKCPDYSKPVEAGGLKIHLKPQCYKDVERAAQIKFQEQQLLRTITNENLPDTEKAKRFDQHLSSFVDLSIESLASSTSGITDGDGVTVTKKEFIVEFYKNCDAKIIKQVNTALTELAMQDVQKQTVTCPSCNHQYDASVEFNAANFFA